MIDCLARTSGLTDACEKNTMRWLAHSRGPTIVRVCSLLKTCSRVQTRETLRAGTPLAVLIGRFLAAALIATLIACSNEPTNGEPAAAQSPGAMSIPLPDELLQVRAINTDQLTVQVEVNGRLVPATRRPDQLWTVVIAVSEGESATVVITFVEDVGGLPLTLATWSNEFSNVTADQTIPIDDVDYSTNFDDDNDGVTNLQERINETDPFDSNLPEHDVLIPRIEPSAAPILNGGCGTVWAQAQTVDSNGDVLAIDNLMRDVGGTQQDGGVDYRWIAMHDGVYMYFLVLGELGELQTPFGDSDRAFNDDSIELFFDGDNSKGESYDGVDDTHFVIALLDENGTTAGRVERGFNSLRIPVDLQFFNTRCATGQQNNWEVRVNLEELGILPGQRFGLEVQINDDTNGGNRDIKWGWIHPTGTAEVFDETFRRPSFMGTAILQ